MATPIQIGNGIEIGPGINIGSSPVVGPPTITGSFTVGPYGGDQVNTLIDVSGYVSGTYTSLTVISCDSFGGDGTADASGIYISFTATAPPSGSDSYTITYTVSNASGTSNTGTVNASVENNAF